MSQYDFGTIDPNTKSGTALASDLNSFRTALHTSHSGSTAPSYITTGMLWVDSTSANLKIKMYDGAQSIDVAIIDATNNVARVAVDSAATSYITATTAAQIKHVIAGVDTATIRSTGLQFNIAAPIIGDSSNNELISFTTTASAVNQINVTNAATATNPVISAVGNDTNIGITLTPKGTGRTNIGQLALDGTTITTTAAQLNVLASVTATAAELNKLAGTPAGLTSTELGFVDGVTSAIQTQLDLKAPLASPALTGTPTAPTATAGTNTTQVATTAFALANSNSQTLLGTLTTTSGSTQTLSSLVLTTYSQLLFEFIGVSGTTTSFNIQIGAATVLQSSSSSTSFWGFVTVPLYTSAVAVPLIFIGTSGLASATITNAGGDARLSQIGYTTATTSVSLTCTTVFDAGSVRIYGVK
jgi:hypothetical protein